VTLATEPVPLAHLRRFYQKVRPPGAWGHVRRPEDPEPSHRLGSMIGTWALASVGLFALLFGLGEVLLGATWLGVLLCVGGAGAWAVALRRAGAWEPRRTASETVAPSPQIGEQGDGGRAASLPDQRP
jgi:hypothetical protein